MISDDSRLEEKTSLMRMGATLIPWTERKTNINRFVCH
jgi:hypothetical protein